MVTTNMFFEGSLSDGIALALREQKLVVCFVTNEQEESLRWESWLKDDEELVTSISNTSVLLRLTADGQEASYLSAFCPITSLPALIAIRNGVPTTHLKPPLTESDFKSAVFDAVQGVISKPTADDATVPTSAAPSAANPESAAGSANPTKQLPDSSRSNTLPNSDALKPSKVPSEDKVKEERAKRAAEIKKSRSDAVSERKRVLAQIENDKKERKLREKEQKRALQDEQKSSTETANQSQVAAIKNHKDCSLKIRTFDGSTISSTFPSEQTLFKHVRPWVESELGSLEAPYEFKQVLAPMPNRKINASEEEESLKDLGLAPNATLVMVPVQTYSTAYGGNASGIVGSSLSYGYGLVSGGLGLAGSLVGSFLGRGTEPAPASSAQSSEPEQEQRNISNLRVRTLADQRRGQDDQQLYNGNQLNFERRKDDEDGE